MLDVIIIRCVYCETLCSIKLKFGTVCVVVHIILVHNMYVICEIIV